MGETYTHTPQVELYIYQLVLQFKQNPHQTELVQQSITQSNIILKDLKAFMLMRTIPGQDTEKGVRTFCPAIRISAFYNAPTHKV